MVANINEIYRSSTRLSELIAKRYQYALDLSMLVLAFALAYLLRFDFHVPHREFICELKQLPYVVLLQFVAFGLAGGYTLIWRYIGMSDMKVFINAALPSSLFLILLRLGLPEELQDWRVPVSVTLIDTTFGFGGLLGMRVLRRVAYEYDKKRTHAGNGHKKSVLLIGAGQAGMIVARTITGRGDMNLTIKGFVDDSPNKLGKLIQGVRVLGTTHDLPRLVREYEIDHVIITLAQASRRDIGRIVKICERIPVNMRIMPRLHELLQGTVEVSHIRNVQVEDLLGREPVHLDEDSIKQFLTGKAVMITGAGGSIGSELARQVARFQPSKLLLVERAEFAIFNIERELREQMPDLTIVPLVSDVGDSARMRSIFKAHAPQVLLHAAAHKHVPMMEFNPAEAMKNNVLGTSRLGKIAGEFGVEVFVLISTDKAVRPTSVMGASKRIAELVIQDLDRRFATRYVAVRFGNVIGSTGSVATIFREQIGRGGPVTVTHPDMIRYFMTIPEAAQLVLQAGTMGQGGEIFILDMGEPIRILDLAKHTIALSGLKPFEDIDIVFTGTRAGEKLVEELGTGEEQIAKTSHPKIFIGKIATYPAEAMRRALKRLEILSQDGQTQELYRFLGQLLPEAHLDFNRHCALPIHKQEYHAKTGTEGV